MSLLSFLPSGGVPLQAQARLVALRALQGNHEVLSSPRLDGVSCQSL